MDLVETIYEATKFLPKEERYALSDQMRRAAISIPSNIAEGHARNSIKSFLHFMSIAQGSRAELETQLLICVRLRYLTEAKTIPIIIQCQEIGKMLYALCRKYEDQ